ncbi:hypothetical protein C9F11_20930 [Streptomyces sp. YIM 121038]|uniref:hypothetical protein n=1 Tax=Streptomyces sp. YIM 121038 TaxID=2136401 RepID=UPI001110B1E7|nr:hypothetical protein [Streptomyces sp. YIM 121038]QCX77818.1 hypothetical protein C9F11_20930 [Streptomyces sp. YIM 121038]
MRIGNHEVLTLHTDPRNGQRTAVLHNGEEWVTVVVPKSFGPTPTEWWHGHYHGESHGDALQDFLARSKLTTRHQELARQAQSLITEWEADADPDMEPDERDQEDEEAAANSFEDRVITLLYELADTL